MSDNAATALATTELLIDRVREIVEEEFSEDELAAMSATEREKLVRMLKFGCAPHLRCLLAKWGIVEEEAIMKPKMSIMSDADKQMRLEPTLNALLLSIQKNFRRGHQQYAKGEQDNFHAFFNQNYPGYVMFDTGRPGTGSRMDANFEVAYAVAMNFKPFLEYLVVNATMSSEAKTLSDSIRVRLGSKEFYAPLICRARFWIKLFAPLRVLCNCHDLEDHNVKDMGAIWDTVEDVMHQLVDDPSLLRDPHFTVFTLLNWPCLKDYYTAKGDKVKLENRVADLEKDRLYGCNDDIEDDVEELVAGMARGVINALYHNAFNFLSSCDGKYAFDKWEDNMIEETKHCVADNILLAESFSVASTTTMVEHPVIT